MIDKCCRVGLASSFVVAVVLSLPVMTASAFERGPVTGLQLPRFVSVKANPANVRRGPGTGYPIKFTIVRRGLPLEITAEFENWRRIRDWSGEEGWILGALLSGRRTALIRPWSAADPVSLYASASSRSSVAAIVHPRVLVTIAECDGTWCEVNAQGRMGYIQQTALWGAYPNEVF